MSKSFYLLENYQALGTVWYIELFGMYKNTDQVQARLIEEIESFQKKYSRFKEDSLLNKFNREGNILIDSDLFEMLNIGEIWRIETDGVFDIAIKKQLEKIGYGQTEGMDGNSNEEIPSVSRVAKKEGSIIWNSKKQIDLGGIGKGFLIDKLARILKTEYNIQYFLINGGGDIYATSNEGESIDLLLEHPTEIGMYIGKVSVKDSSLCVSSSFKRSWVKEGHRYNHFIDTKQSTVVESASYVLAETATTADILATILALLSHNESSVSLLAEKHKAEYLTLNSKGEIYCSPVFKNALEAL